MASINQQTCETRQLISVNGVDDTDLPNAFNSFFSRFERSDFLDKVSTPRESFIPQNDIVISREWVATLFKRMKTGKAAGPDAICGRTLRYCAGQLKEARCVQRVDRYLFYGKQPL